MTALEIVLVVAAAVILLFCIFAAVSYSFAFGKRYDINPDIKYFTAKDFGLCAEEIVIGKLNGIIYSEDGATDENIIIFVHGMGPGHIAYTTEIAYFCRQGYTVIAVDSLGCNASGGRSIRGMYEGVKSALQTIDFAKKQFPESRISLVGHSWGGYSVLCASALRKVDKVIAISAPSSPVRTIYEGAGRVLSPFLAGECVPFWWLINLFIFGKNGNLNAAKCADKSGTPTLIIHGGIDGVVSPLNAAYYRANGENVTKFLAEGKAHNPYNTVTAEQKLKELSYLLSRKESLDGFDFQAATEEDEEVMKIMCKFLSEN